MSPPPPLGWKLRFGELVPWLCWVHSTRCVLRHWPIHSWSGHDASSSGRGGGCRWLGCEGYRASVWARGYGVRWTSQELTQGSGPVCGWQRVKG